MEIVVPLFFNIILLIIRLVVSKDDIDKTSYYENPTTFSPNVIGTLPTQLVGEDLTYVWKDEEKATAYAAFLASNKMKTCYCDSSKSKMKDCYRTLFFISLLKACLLFIAGIAALAPANNPIINEIDSKLQEMGIVTKQYNDNDEIDNWTREEAYKDGPYFCMGIVLTQYSNDNYEYLLRFNSSLNEEIMHEKVPRVNNVLEEDFDCSNRYIDTGFLTLQNWIDNAILREETKNADAYIKPQLASMKTDDHVNDDFQEDLRGSISFFTVLPLILIIINFVSKLLYEKEKRIKEGMKMMGMTNTSFYLSWIVTYLIILFILALCQAIILKILVLKHCDFFIIFFLFYLFGITMIAEGFFIQVFFSRVMIGMIITMVAFLLQYMFTNFAEDDDTSFKSKKTKVSLSIFPQVAVASSLNNMLNYEIGEDGVTWGNFTETFQRYNVGIGFLMMILFSLILFLLGIYLDQVFPNEFGTKKHPLFFLGFGKKDHLLKNKIDQQKIDAESQSIQDNREAVDAQQQQQNINHQTVFVENLKKYFPNGTKAVNNISFSMYQNEISILLGHNGAGKTTTISMLTGLLDITGGTAQVFDKSVQDEMEEIRQFLGICPQHDILFDKLTVKEHLELFATFKGLEKEAIEEEVTKMIKDLDLEEKTNSLSMTLSGGQKRRLSVGIAFIGDSRFVVLDEPTSGMDTSARRFIWNMLKNYKTGRVILLTTHFMDEADYLGDKITIMSGGKIKASGSPLFLKNRFGVGYNLVVVKKTQEKNAKIFEIIKGLIPTAIQLSDVSSEITFQLPMESKDKFEELFDYFDKNQNELNIQTYGISITTLEEVFLKVAEIESNKQKENEMKEFKEQLKQSMTQSQKMKQQNYLNNEENIFDKKIEFNTNKIQLFWQHFWALIAKRVHSFKRDKKGLLCELFLPCIMIVIGLLLMTTSFIEDPEYMKLSPSLYDDLPLNLYYAPSASLNTVSLMEKYDTTNQDLHPIASTDIKTLDDELFEKKDKFTLGGYFFTNIDNDNNQYEYIEFYNSIAPESLPLYMNLINQAILRKATGRDIKITVYQAAWRITKKFETLNSSISGLFCSFYFSLAMSFIPASIIVFLTKEKMINAKHQQRVSGVTYFAYWIANYTIDYVKYLLPCIVAPLMAQAFDVDSVTDQEEKRFTCFIIINVLYGFSLIAFTYLFTFVFTNHGTAQLSIFFISLMLGTTVVMTIFILRVISSTRDVAKVLHWFFRFFPPFTYGYGLMNIANVELYGIGDSDLEDVDVFHIQVAGPDVVYLAILGPLLFVSVLLIEKFKTAKSVTKMFDHKNAEEKYELPKNLDSDVLREIKEVEASPAENYSLKVDKLRKVYPNGYVGVKQISFGIQNGDCFSLLGVNGAGKTTTFKMLCGEHPATEGDAFINGFSVNNNLSEAQKIIGYCPQFDALLELLTVREHLDLYANIKGIKKEQIPELINDIITEMNLKKFENINAGQLSGGNKRKLSVAIAMIGNPPIIFLDEPSTGMDPAARRFMWTVISRISTLRKKSSVVLTTHSMEEAEALSTKLGIMVAGEFKCIGSVQHIKNKFGKGYEIEVKLKVQTQEQIQSIIKKLKEEDDRNLSSLEECKDILSKLGKPELSDLIKLEEAGSAIFTLLKSGSKLPIEMLIEFYLIEQQGELVKQFLRNNFKKFFVIEHYGSYFRFKLNSDISVGKLFGKFEKEQNNLAIANYSIKQATIEQIFNLFAEGKMDDMIQQDNQSNSQSKSSKVTPIQQSEEALVRDLQLELEDIVQA